jgi:hypothetical protein
MPPPEPTMATAGTHVYIVHWASRATPETITGAYDSHQAAIAAMVDYALTRWVTFVHGTVPDNDSAIIGQFLAAKTDDVSIDCCPVQSLPNITTAPSPTTTATAPATT